MTVPIRILSVGFIAIGLLYLVGFQIGIYQLTHHANWYLPHFYGPGTDQDYRALYEYAEQITKHRNFYAQLSHALIGVVIMLLGALGFTLMRPAPPEGSAKTSPKSPGPELGNPSLEDQAPR